MIKSNGTVKLGDIGSAKIINSKKTMDSLVGTCCWMAPEVIKGNEYDYSADIWSLGCTTFEMLTGKPPFESQNNYGAMMKIVNYKEEDFIIPPGLSYFAADFIKCCLKKNNKERPNALILLKHPFLNN